MAKLYGPQVATLSVGGKVYARGEDGAFEVPDGVAEELIASFGFSREAPIVKEWQDGVPFPVAVHPALAQEPASDLSAAAVPSSALPSGEASPLPAVGGPPDMSADTAAPASEAIPAPAQENLPDTSADTVPDGAPVASAPTAVVETLGESLLPAAPAPQPSRRSQRRR